MSAHRLRVGLAVSALGFAAFTGTAAAQVSGCNFSDCTPQGEEVTPAPSGGGVLGENANAPCTEATPGGTAGGGTTGGATSGEMCQQPTTGVLGNGATAGAPAAAEAASAPSGSLPFTGGDVAGLVLVGGAAIGAGALMIRRSRTQQA